MQMVAVIDTGIIITPFFHKNVYLNHHLNNEKKRFTTRTETNIKEKGKITPRLYII